jgi:hypothetical protein
MLNGIFGVHEDNFVQRKAHSGVSFDFKNYSFKRLHILKKVNGPGRLALW